MCRTTIGEIAKAEVFLASGHCNCITGTEFRNRRGWEPHERVKGRFYAGGLYNAGAARREPSSPCKHEVMPMESRDVIEEYLAAIETVRAAFADVSRELLFL